MDNELFEIASAVIIRDSLTLFMNKLTEQHKSHPDYAATMTFCGQIYKKFAKIAAQKVETDEMGHIVIRRDIRTDFNNN